MNWSSTRMTEIEIEVPTNLVRKVTEMLAYSGLISLEDVSYLTTDQQAIQGNEWQSKATEFNDLERQVLTIMKSLKIPTGEPEDKDFKILSESSNTRQFADQIDREVREVVAGMETNRKEVDTLRSYLDLVTPFQEFSIRMDSIRNRRYIYSILGTIPSGKVERFKESMENIPFALIEYKQVKNQSIVLLLGTRRHMEYLQRAAKSAYLNSIDLPDEYQGTPKEIIEQINAEIGALNLKINEANENVNKLRTSQAKRLQEIYWHVHMSRLMSEAITKYGQLKNGYLISGWVPSGKVKSLEDTLHSISEDILINIKPQPDKREVSKAPVALDHKGFFRGFQKLVTTYGVPGYEDLDPTLLLAITFPLIFGAMFGDLGQGALLALGGVLLMSGKIKKLNRLSSLGTVVLLCGFVSMVFGVLYGSVFGFETWIEALWQHPMENITNILLITIGGGALLLMIANVLAMINFIRKRQWIKLVFSGKGLAGLLLYWSLIGLLLSLVIKTFPIPRLIFTILAIAAAMMIFSEELIERVTNRKKPLFEHGFLVYLIQAFFELFEAILSFLSNTLSFVRVGAFAVAHMGLSSVFFILAEMISPSKGLGYWVVIVIGNIFILGFEGMIVSIQTLRLQYYEFFSKFFSGGGKKYAPFQVSHSVKQGVK